MATDVKALFKRKEGPNVFQRVNAERPKAEIDLTALMERRGKASWELNMWRGLLETAYSWSVPNYNPWVNLGRGGAITPGTQLNAGVFDLTLPIAHQKLVNKMLVGMVPQGQQWLKFLPGEAFGAEDSSDYMQALGATQKFTDQFFTILDKSNFYLSVAESMSDTLISTGVLAINEGNYKSPFRFEACPVSQVMFEGNPMGGIDAVFRDWFEVKVNFVKILWPEAREPSNKGPTEKVNIYECSYIDHKADAKERYKYAVMTDQKELLFESAGSSWPWVIYRMRKLTGETRGRGPTLDAYPTAATINEALGDELMAAAFTANPMFMAASDSAFNPDTFKARPGNIIPCQMIMGQWPIQIFPHGGDIQFSALIINDFRQQINELLFSAPLGPITAPDKTATEQNIRYMENLENFSAVAPRLQTEFFDPVIGRCLYILNKVRPEMFEGMGPEIRQKIISLDGEILSLRYETPLMTARGQIKANALLGFYQTLAAMVGPEAATATLKPAELTTAVARYSGANLDVIRSQEEIEQMQEQAAEYAQQSMEQGMVPGDESQQQNPGGAL
jgi:hypothetical protein